MFWKILKIILVFLCMASIFLFSNDDADASNLKSDGVVVHIAEFLAGHSLNKEQREEKIEKYVVYVRKTAHFSIYLLLGFLMISLIKEYRELTWKELFLAFFLSFLYACSDEVHQLFVSGRSGNIIDVGIDSMGAYFGVLFYYFYYRIRRKIHE